MSRSSTNGFQMVTISPNVPGSIPNGMSGDFSRMTIMSSTDPPAQPQAEADPRTFVKAKRKRLSKACENCHKSKRRCDGTAPCSNCYFASKPCIYLDKDGKQVPAPRSGPHEPSPPAASAPGAQPRADGTPASALQTNGQVYAVHSGQRRQADRPDASAKRARPEGLSPASSGSAAGSSPRSEDVDEGEPAPELDSTMTLELVNLFFTHCNPHRLIFHKPSFSAALAQDAVPPYLLLAVCALAAPWAPELRARAQERMPRLAGVPFFLAARRAMFDGAGHLLAPPTLATAQALCLLEMHEVAASHSWTQHYRYFDLAMQFLEGTLQITQPDAALAAGVAPARLRDYTVERECVRRCFWLVQTMCWINGIYTFRPLRPRSVELVRAVRLPAEEAGFELARMGGEAEYLHTPAPRTRNASQFGHVCRILSMYQVLQSVIAKDANDSARASGLAACRDSVDAWLASLPPHLRFSEENLEKQITMHETSSNTGAWCFCFVHTLHPCYLLDLYEASLLSLFCIFWGALLTLTLSWLVYVCVGVFLGYVGGGCFAGAAPGLDTRPAEGDFARDGRTGEELDPLADHLLIVLCVHARAAQTYSKYFPTDPDVEEWDRQFESLWGYRVAVVAHHWRETQRQQRAQIGRAYPVEGVPQRETAPAFAVAESDSPSPSTVQYTQTRARQQARDQARDVDSSASSSSPASTAGSRSPEAYSRGSPREKAGAPLARGGSGSSSSVGGGRPRRERSLGREREHGRRHEHEHTHGHGHGHTQARLGHARTNSSPRTAPSTSLSPSVPPRVAPAARALHGQQSLPSLKASGLLDSWRPPVPQRAGGAPAGLDWLNEGLEK
ncbi:hypothetical protein EIP86_005610 [Pleurotus ostreatoroseus]|nr:hypothetical protein EIP86_005610 [Pleurotus ostreatoroseus]